jgi:hypothetical protein
MKIFNERDYTELVTGKKPPKLIYTSGCHKNDVRQVRS